VDFCNPNLLGQFAGLIILFVAHKQTALDEYANFRRIYEVPILKSRAPDCTAKEAELGESRSARVCRSSLL